MNDFNPQATAYDPHNALWLGQAAALAYQAPQQIQSGMAAAGLPNCVILANAATDTQGYIAGNDAMVLIAFRGTEADRLNDWLTDLDAEHTSGPHGKVHKGFYVRGLLSVWDQLSHALPAFIGRGQTVWLTGHSLGAAIANLAAAELLARQCVKAISGLYTFGEPRAGNADFSAWFNQLLKPRTFRFVNDNDIVPHVPPPALAYRHNGVFLHFDAQQRLQTDESVWDELKDALLGRVEDLVHHGVMPPVIEDHFMDNYLGALRHNLGTNPFA